jgi:hypothetical protein
MNRQITYALFVGVLLSGSAVVRATTSTTSQNQQEQQWKADDTQAQKVQANVQATEQDKQYYAVRIPKAQAEVDKIQGEYNALVAKNGANSPEALKKLKVLQADQAYLQRLQASYAKTVAAQQQQQAQMNAQTARIQGVDAQLKTDKN